MRSFSADAGSLTPNAPGIASTQGVPAIVVRDLSMRFGTREGPVQALDGVSFEVAEGEFIAVVGRSGCGKTTLMRILGGLTQGTSGRVQVRGRDVTAPLRDVGIVFQAPTLLPWRTVFDNVMLPAEFLKLDLAEARIRAADLLKLVGLSGFERRLPRELSGGMQQRAAISRALLHDPALLLLDEPFGALDALTREEMNLELLRIWSERRKTSLLITHSIPEAVFLADRVIVMTPRPGRVAEIVPVPLPRPRTGAMRLAPDFAALVRHIGERIGVKYDGG
jgi:NitT/TauT family transport system ATP-binding protein